MRTWWVVPVIVAVVGGGVLALVFAPRLADRVPVPDQVLVDSRSTPDASPSPTPRHHHPTPTPRPTPTATSTAASPATVQPTQRVITPDRPVESEGPDAHGGERSSGTREGGSHDR